MLQLEYEPKMYSSKFYTLLSKSTAHYLKRRDPENVYKDHVDIK